MRPFVEEIHVHPLDNLLEHLDYNTIEGGVLESTLSGLGERRADGEGDDDIIGMLLGAIGIDVEYE